MKTAIRTLSMAIVSVAALSIQAQAAVDIRQAVINHSVTISTLKLLNQVSGNSCRALESDDVQMACLGALPPDIKKPTLVPTGCMFSFKIECSNGISASLSGANQGYMVLGPKNAIYDSGGPGVIISNVELHGI